MSTPRAMPVVWMLNHYAALPHEPGGVRHYSLARHLRSCGWHAPIITAGTRHPSGQSCLAPDERIRHYRVDGVDLFFLKCPEYTGNGLGRMRNMAGYAWRAADLGRSRPASLPRPDVVIGSCVHPLAVLSACRLAKRFRIPFLFEIRDLWPETLVTFGTLRPRSPMTQALYLLEKYLLRRAARIVSLLPGVTDYVVSRGGIPAEKVTWIPNGIDLDWFDARKQDAPLIERPADWSFVLSYFGAMGNANDLPTILKGFATYERRHPEERAGLLLIGDGPLKSAMQDQAKQLEIRRICWAPPVPKDAIPALTGISDAFVVAAPDRPELYRFGVSPNKIFDYMAGGKPTLFAISAANDPVAESGGGLTIPSGNAERLADAIAELVAMPTRERENMGARARAFVAQRHDYAHLAQTLVQVLEDVRLAA